MRQPRFPIAGLMMAIAAVAVNLAVMRAFDQAKPDSISHLFFACGVMPTGTVLVLVALFSIQKLARGGWLSPFVLGFEALGWVMIFIFIALYSTAPSAILAFTEWTGRWTRPILIPLLGGFPISVQMFAELGFATVLFSFPQLAIALLGGLLNRKLGFTLRFDRRVSESAAEFSERILTQTPV